jgi:hypothetical protein
MEVNFNSVWSKNFACNMENALDLEELRTRRHSLVYWLSETENLLSGHPRENQIMEKIKYSFAKVRKLREAEKSALAYKNKKTFLFSEKKKSSHDFIELVKKLRKKVEDVAYEVPWTAENLLDSLDGVLVLTTRYLLYNSSRRGGKTRRTLSNRNNRESGLALSAVVQPSLAGPISPVLAEDFHVVIAEEEEQKNTVKRLHGTCTICLDSLVLNEAVFLDCLHSFHDDCVEAWLRMSNICPVCRYPVNGPTSNILNMY